MGFRLKRFDPFLYDAMANYRIFSENQYCFTGRILSGRFAWSSRSVTQMPANRYSSSTFFSSFVNHKSVDADVEKRQQQQNIDEINDYNHFIDV